MSPIHGTTHPAACGTIAQNTVKRSLSQGLTKRQTSNCDIYYSQGFIRVIVFNWTHYCYPYLLFLSFENHRLQEAARIHDQGNDFLLRLVGGDPQPSESFVSRNIRCRRHWLTNNWHAFQTRSIPRQRCIPGRPGWRTASAVTEPSRTAQAGGEGNRDGSADRPGRYPSRHKERCREIRRPRHLPRYLDFSRALLELQSGSKEDDLGSSM
jgi:hypothetical protein